MELLISICLSLVLGAIVVEIYVWIPNIARWLLKYATRRLNVLDQTRYKEEWESYLNDLPNSMLKLIHAVSYCLAVTKINVTILRDEQDRLISDIARLSEDYEKSLPLLVDARRVIVSLREEQRDITGIVEQQMGDLAVGMANRIDEQTLLQLEEAFRRFGVVLMAADGRLRALADELLTKAVDQIETAGGLIQELLRDGPPSTSSFPYLVIRRRKIVEAMDERRSKISQARDLLEAEGEEIHSIHSEFSRIRSVVDTTVEKISRRWGRKTKS